MPLFWEKSGDTRSSLIAQFLVLELQPGVPWELVDKKIQRVTPGCSGRVLTRLGHLRFLVADAAVRILLARSGTRGALEASVKTKGVSRVMFVDQDTVLQSYRNRPALDGLPSDVIGVPSIKGKIWHLDRIGAPAAARLVQSADTAVADVRIAIIGTGYTHHGTFGFPPAGAPPIIVEAESQSLLEPYLSLTEELNHVGSAGHGTRVGSLVCGRFVGAAGGLRLIVYRVIDSPIMTAASASTVAAAIKHAVLDNGCEIVLLTCGDPKENVAELASQVDLAYNNGAVVIAAAGELASTVAFPARYSRPITVSGTTSLDEPWTAAARGIAVDICAPACDITLADTVLCAGVSHPIYRRGGDGTAYAAAQVAAAAALWLAYHRQDLAAHAQSWHLVEALRQCLAASATRPAGWTDRLWGAGILNVARLLRTPVPDTSQLTQRPACSEQQL